MTDLAAVGTLALMAAPVVFVFYMHTKPPREKPCNEIRIATPIKAPPKPKPVPGPSPAKPEKPAKLGPSADTIKAMHIQADAERAIAETLERKAQREPDPVKRTRLEKQIANSWLRFNKILDQIDKLMEGQT